MTKWLRSGLRRDVCVVVHSLDEPTGQECKTALEDHYGERIDAKTFYGALDSLGDADHLTEEADGIHDRYALTTGGERALRAHYDWLSSCIEG